PQSPLRFPPPHPMGGGQGKSPLRVRIETDPRKEKLACSGRHASMKSNTLEDYPLLTALHERRSRRFGLGMKMPAGPLAFESRHAPVPLTEAEEAALAFAAYGITGHALADLCYAPGGGGAIMAG